MFPITPKEKILTVFLIFVLSSVVSYLFIDLPLVIYISENVSKHDMKIAQIMTYPVEPLLIPIYVLVILTFIQQTKKYVARWIHQGTAVLATITIVTILKYVFSRPRPSYFLTHGFADISLFNIDQSFISMPSGHAAGAGLIAAFLWMFLSGKWRYLMIVPAFIAFLRAYCLKHFLSDVIVGFGVGFCTALYFHLFDKTWLENIKEKIWKLLKIA